MFNMFNFILILLSLVFLIYSIFICRRMITAFTRPIHKRAGAIMMALMIIFFLGYIIYLLFSYNLLYTNFMASLLFFATAFFVMLVVQMNHSFIISLTMKSMELKDFSEKLLKETESLSSGKEQLERIKALLEQKNSEQEAALKKWSAWRLSLLDKLSSKEQQKPQEAAEQSTEQTAEQSTEKPDEPGSEENK